MSRAGVPFLFALGWLAGCALQLRQPALWPASAYHALLAAGLTLAVMAWWAARRRRAVKAIAAVIAALGAGVLLGVGWAGALAAPRLAQRLPAGLEGRDLVVTGVVAQLPQNGVLGVRFVFEVESARDADGPVTLPTRLSLAWYRQGRDEADNALADPRAELGAGQRWRLPVRLRRPHGLLNPEGFDLELWLFERELGATGYVRVLASGGVPAQRLAHAAAHPVERLRQHLRTAILRAVPDARAAGVIAALVVGDQAAIERADWDLFRLTGIAHLMSISGLHVTMFAWLGAALTLAAWRRWPRGCLRVPAPVAARWGGLALACAYAMLAGWGVPAQRTVLMLAGVAVLRSLGPAWPWPLVLLLAAVAVTASDPWALLQPGFGLSFMAVGLLMASEPAQRGAAPAGARAWLAAQLRAQAIATVGLAPLSMVFFQQVSVVGALANGVAIPWVTLVLTPLALAGCLLPWLWTPAAWAVAALVAVLQPLGAWPAAMWSAPAVPGWAAAAGLAAALTLVLPWPWRWKAVALPLAAPLLWPALERPPPGRFELVAADVGQGTAVLVRTTRHLLVYDTGPAYSPDTDAGQRVLLPLLRARGERRVDRLVLSHRDSDHTGGAASLVAGLPVGDVLGAPVPSTAPGAGADAPRPPQRPCAAGERWTWDGVAFETLHPLAMTPETAAALRPNALSCVVKVTDAHGRSALLTGDIEAPQEADLVGREGQRLATDVLLAPHHGSRTSSSDGFLAATGQPRVVVQAGYRSRFGHPAPPVLARYAAHGLAVVRSDRCGAWRWRSDRPPAEGVCERDRAPRYWHDRAAGPLSES